MAIFSEPLARVAEQYLRKGSKVYIEGQLETRKWQDQSGQDRYSTEVVLRPYRSELTMLDGKNSGSSDGGNSYTPRENPTGDAMQAAFDAQKPLDDEIPF